MLKIHMFCLEDFFVYVLKYFFNGISKNFVDETHKAKNMMDFLSEKRSELGVLREDDISKPLIALRSSVEERIHPKHD